MILNEVLLLNIAAIVIAVVLPSTADQQKNECTNLASCSSCILTSSCVWCVTKSKCTKQECGNDNIIYPDNYVGALMAGSNFCPRVVEADVRTIKSGTKEKVVVKITQIHLYMAFTPWKCKIIVDGKDRVINAALLGDSVFCEEALFENKSESPYVNGTVSVMWDYSKTFDGAVPVQVCRCDLDPECSACK